MNLYDLNKQGYLTLDNMTTSEIDNAYEKLMNHLSATCYQTEYFMLLSNEKRDYTVFAFDRGTASRRDLVSEIFSIVLSRGKLKAVEFNEDNTVDFWVLIDDECFMYKLFDYDFGVIEIYG